MKDLNQGRKPAVKPVAPWVQMRNASRKSEDWERKLLKQRPLWNANGDGQNSAGPWTFFCPLCRAQRIVPLRPRLESWQNIVRVSLTTGVLTLALWTWVGWKGVFLAAPVWAIFEVVYRLSLRAKVACRECGFDAYLYLSDLPRARAEVEAFWQQKRGATQSARLSQSAVGEEETKAASAAPTE